MHLPRRLRESAELGFDDDIDPNGQDTDVFRGLLLGALNGDPEVQAAVRRVAGTAKPAPQARSTRRR